MELLLRVRARGQVKDIRCEAEPSLKVQELTAILAQEFDLDAATADLVSLRAGGALNPGMTITDAGLISGDALELMPPGRAPRANVAASGVSGLSVTIDITSGASAGRSLSLSPGRYDIGRAGSAAIHMPDRNLILRHAELLVMGDGSVFVAAQPNVNDVTVDGVKVGTNPVPLGPSATVTVGEGNSFTSRLVAPALPGGRDLAGQMLFNRTPYFRPTVRDVNLGQVPSIPRKPSKTPFNFLTLLVPVLMGLVLYVLTKQIATLAFIAMSPVMMLGSSAGAKRNAKKDYTHKVERWEAALAALRTKVTAAVEEERSTRLAASPSVAQVQKWAESRSTSTWCRAPEDPDFLEVRIGTGTQKCKVKLEMDRVGGDAEVDEDFTTRAEAVVAIAGDIDDVPIVANLAALGVVGVWGQAGWAERQASAMLVQAAVMHSPQELVICAALGDNPQLGWLRWLPHARSVASPIDGPHVMSGPATSRALVDALCELRDARSGTRSIGGQAPTPHMLLVVSEDAGVEWSTMARLLDNLDKTSISVLWVGNAASRLPRQCRLVVGGAGARGGVICQQRTEGAKSESLELSPEPTDIADAEHTAQALAPLRDAAASSASASIPRSVPLADVLGAAAADPVAVQARWKAARPGTLHAAIGFNADGPWMIDLVEHGPHGLIAGTSGAGKSELLQSLVASLAAAYPPDMLNFLFIDYKGGAAFGSCETLPHNVGMVTDLDETLAMRALTSLRAELKRRESLLSGKARDLNELARVDPQNCPPRLAIVVDEFATLVREIPEFVAGMVDVAQRGRSLGIHLVLATQRPAGAVSDNILANTNLRICLRVLDNADSSSVIGTGDAAGIPAPLRGRAYARTGPRELMEFQSAWANAPVQQQLQTARITVEPFSVTTADNYASQPNAQVSLDGEPQLDQAVAAIVKAAEGMPTPRRPWLDPLDETVALADVLALAPDFGDGARHVVWGMIDDPSAQAQYPAVCDMEEDGGLLIAGSGGSGKTTVLRSIAASLAVRCTTQQVVIYGIDYASRALEQLKALPHCGGVAHGDEPEQVTRLLRVLEAAVKERKTLLAEHNAASLSELSRQQPDMAPGRIMVLVDNLGGFMAAFQAVDGGEWANLMTRLILDGRQVGVHFVLTADRRASIPSAVFSAVSGRLVLKMAERDELIALGVPSSIADEVDLPAGRGFLDRDLTAQAACVSKEVGAAAQVKALVQLGQSRHNAGPSQAGKLQSLPVEFPSTQMPAPAAAGMAMVGLEDLSLACVGISLTTAPFMVLGRPQSGRTNALRVMAINAAAHANAPSLFGLSASNSLDGLSCFVSVGGAHDVDDLVAGALAEADVRDTKGSVVVFIDDAEVFAEGPAGLAIEKLMRHGSVQVVFATESHAVNRAYAGWMSDAKRSKRALLLVPDIEMDGGIVGARLKVRPGLAWVAGRGFLCADGPPQLVQVAFEQQAIQPAADVWNVPTLD